MLFNSFHFCVFLPVVLIVYYNVSHRIQNWFLLAASCYFYASWDWRFLFPLLFSTSIDYYCAGRMERLMEEGKPIETRRPFLLLSLVTNLGLLGFFKYFNFFVDSFQTLLQRMGMEVNPWTLKVVLPIGISFYTFQALSYTIDVYRGQFHATRKFTDFLLAVLYFPHLVAGPIQRANSLLPQVIKPREITKEKIAEGLHLIVWGFFKKVVIADRLSPIVDQVFNAPATDGFQILTATYAFAFQIYGDFSGYTDIARGVAKIMGFEFMLNFNLPYLTTNARDFWSRWHISLSTWLRDYLYIPLGGNRGGTTMVYRNLMLTMVIGGFWHGAAWNFLIWGFYQGLMLCLHRYFEPVLNKIWDFPGQITSAISFWVRVLLMFQITCYGWLIFRVRSLDQLIDMTRVLFTPSSWHADSAMFLQVFWIASPIIVVQLIQHHTKRLDFTNYVWMRAELRAVIYAVAMYMVLFHGGKSEAFIYFQF